jgi:predicted AlkP superfamily pyrophosphatase or phosphodiesterase
VRRAHRLRFAVCLAAFVAAAASGTCASALPPATVLLVSLDGFRPDYLERFEAPVLNRLARTGVRADYLIPVFPTKTYPNHYTIVTGLYPDHHGIVMNRMWDPVWQRRFDGDGRGRSFDEWWGGEPIWVTARRQGRVASTMFWPGSDAEIGGVRPNDWAPYERKVKNDVKVGRVLSWLDRPPARRPAVATLYLSDADDDGHRYGPESKEIGGAVRRLDATLGALVAGLETRGLFDAIDVIIVSDHGMAQTPPDQFILLDELIDLADVEVSDWSPVLALWPKAGRSAAVQARLRGAHPHLTVYQPSELPERWHLGTNRRVPPLLGVADEGWTITTRERYAAAGQHWNYGSHGYDNALASMRAVFLAHGPHFVRGVVVPPFSNVHVYELICRILGLQPAPNDGQLAEVARVLASR